MLFKKSQLGWRLLRQSLTVLWEQKKLIILSLIGRGFFFLIFTAVSVLLWLIRTEKIDYNHLSTRQWLYGYGIMVLAFWVANIVSAYFNAALMACLLQYERQEQIHLMSGLKLAAARFWTLFSWITGHFVFLGVLFIMRSQSAESKRINQLLSGLKWGFAAFFMPAVIMNEPADFFSSLQRSSSLMRNYAGLQPKINYSNTFLNFFLRIISMIPFILGYHSSHPVSLAIGVAVSFLLLLAVTVLLNGGFVILIQALYEYVAWHKVSKHFLETDLGKAISKHE